MSKKGRILVGMSGGVDSTVTALLLHEQGYEVIGITLNILDYNYTGERVKNPCCSIESIMGAKEIANFIGFKHFIIDVKNEFQSKVVDKFVDEYMAGRTPNPCIRCNSDIKWGEMIRQADIFDCEKIATGHYANVNEQNGRYYLTRGKDKLKDQTYFLWALDQYTLSRTIFPLGELTKPEVRSIAFTRGHTQIAHKQENFDICFVPDNDYRLFLKERIPDLEEKYAGGYFVDVEGNVLGKHKGYMNYTIGQRKGLGIALGKPVYVVSIAPKTNTVVIGERDKLNKNGLFVNEINMMKYEEISEPKEVSTMVRYKSQAIESKVSKFDDSTYEITFEANVQGIASGQSAVFYEGDDVVGGGIIKESF